MQDRLKYRVWDKINEVWIENSLLDTKQGCIAGFYMPEKAMKRRIVVEQCTGLKDKNGKLIYEGDIVIYEVYTNDWSDEKRRGFGVIYYDEEQHALGLKTIKQTLASSFGLNKLISEIEVVRNIHKNPELLEQKDEKIQN